MKGIFRLRPSLPKYSFTYNASTVLKYLEKMPPPELISLKEMSLKFCMLLCLLTAQRDQVLPSLDVTKMQLTENKCCFLISDIMRTTRPGKHMKPIELKTFPANKELCPVSQIRHLNMTAGIRGVFIKLFISYTPPHMPVTASTLSRWCRLILQKAGIDSVFTSHSTRAASTSKAYSMGMSPAEITRQQAGQAHVLLRNIIKNQFMRI